MIKKERNYGVLTEISQDVNAAFGDNTGRTVSMRTAHGLQRFLKEDIHQNEAEDIAHGAMVASSLLLASKSDGAKIGGLLLLFGLIVCYQNGRDY